MWQLVQVSVGPATYRGRFRVEGRWLILEWAGGRVSELLGMLKPEIVATLTLKRYATRLATAA